MNVKEGDYAILQKGPDHQLFRVMEKKPVYFCKQKVCLGNLIGKPYGSLYELKGKDLFLVKNVSSDLPIETESSVQDNRYLNDDGTSQQLTKEEIEALKSKGASSVTIVKNLIDNSATFNNKTQYSQEKYVRKKTNKYFNFIRVLKTNSRLLAELYFKLGPTKICNLRMDMLSQMLTSVNVMSGGRYMVVDSCNGLLVAAVLEKVLPEGKVIQIYTEPGPLRSYRLAVEAMNFDPNSISLYGMSYTKLNSQSETPDVILDVTEENVVLPEKIVDSPANMSESESCLEIDNEEMPDTEDKRNSFTEKKQAKLNRKALRKKETEAALKFLNEKDLDGLLVCCRQPPGPLSLDLLDYLSPSRPFALHSMTLQPLVEAYDQLKTSNKAVYLKLTETWLRKYQVLPERTHPQINMSNTGGYLLTGIKVEPVSQ